MYLDEQDIIILMHRNIHFGGSFDEMLQFYEDIKMLESNNDVDIERVEELKSIEEDGTDLNAFLESKHIEEIEEKTSMYNVLKEFAECGSDSKKFIAELIMSAEIDEEYDFSNAGVLDDDAITYLVEEIIERDDYYAELSPGQGKAPAAALGVLESIGDSSAIVAVFNRLFNVSTYMESIFMKYFRSFEAETLEILQGILSHKRWSKDHERAVVIAGSLCFDQTISDLSFSILQDVQRCPQDAGYQAYLVLLANGDSDFSQKREDSIDQITHLSESAKTVARFSY